MVTIRRGTFETNSSSTHSFAIKRDSRDFERLQTIFNLILYGGNNYSEWVIGINEISDEEDLLELLKLLHEAQTIIMEGTEEY